MSRDADKFNCPVDTTLGMIGGKYKSLILWHLVDSTLRFGELRKRIPQATAKMLTQQLRELEADELILREVFPIVPPKVEYSLSPLGKSLRPVLTAMYNWGADYLTEKGLRISCSMTVPELQRP
jgi:DNA-binding HxlR family transcriptional regulator